MVDADHNISVSSVDEMAPVNPEEAPNIIPVKKVSKSKICPKKVSSSLGKSTRAKPKASTKKSKTIVKPVKAATKPKKK
jgi:hypothetical protein